MVCARCESMSMVNYTSGECRPDCVDCNPPAPRGVDQ